MEGAGVDWAVCGGYAIDLIAGCRTRNHADLDAAVFQDQRGRLLAYLLGGNWRIFEADTGLMGRCRRDFTAAAPLPDGRQRLRLQNALQRSYPNSHEWLGVLQERA